MVKHHFSSSILNYSWDQVARAFWNRYPNPYSCHVLSEDVISRDVINGKLVTKKLITKTNKIPKWGERFIRGTKANGVHMIEESILDLSNRTLVTYTRNIGLTSILLVGEKTTYKVEATPSASSTLCERTGWAESTLRLYGVARPIEAFAIDRFKKNIKSTQNGLEYVLEKLFGPVVVPELSISKKAQLREKAKQAKEIATRAGQTVVTYTGKTAA